jgi:uncharacterized membrane protein YvbJ
MVCPQCGAEVVAEAIFCHKCGHQLVQRDPQFEPVPRETPAPTPSPMEKFKAAAAGANAGEEPEGDLWRGGYSPKAMIGAWCLCAFVSAVLLIIGIFGCGRPGCGQFYCWR